MSDPSAAEFLALVDELRTRGCVRVAWGAVSVDFAHPVGLPGQEAVPLTSAERERLYELEVRYQRDEELGNG